VRASNLFLPPADLFQSEALNRDLAVKSARGGLVTIVEFGLEMLIAAVTMVVLARLLNPDDFGLIGMTAVVINFLTMFKNAGLSMATVQRKEINAEQVGTLFWLNVFLSLILGLLILALAPLLATFYNRSELIGVTIVMSASFFVSGISIQHQALLRRHMRFVTLAVIRIFPQISGLLVAISLALLGWGYWALVFSVVVSTILNTCITFIFCPWMPGWIKRNTGVRDMLRFGGYLTGSNFTNYFALNTDKILIGRFIGADALGLYTMAYKLFFFIGQIKSPIIQVAMPVLSSLQAYPPRYVRYFHKLSEVIFVLITPIAVYCAIEAEMIVTALLGDQWLSAVPVFRILSFSLLIQPTFALYTLALLTKGYSDRNFYLGLVSSLLTVMAFFIGLPFGIEGVAIAYTVVNYILLFPAMFYAFNKTEISVLEFLTALTLPIVFCIIAAVASIVAKQWMMTNAAVTFLLSLAVFCGVYLGLSLSRSSVRETIVFFIDRAPAMIKT
jgi:O-antigen/teichoic acid export membrane protein